MATERVEFVDSEAVGPAAEDLLTVGGPGGDGRPGRWGLAAVGLIVLAVVAALLVGRAATGDDATPGATATPSSGFVGRPTPPVTTPIVGLVGLPRAITNPREMVSAQTGDVVWMRDSGAGVVRIENGQVTAVQLLESQVTAMAVSPSGRKLYVSTAADRPSLQVLDATTLALGTSRPLESGSISALAVSIDAVWAASGGSLLRLDVDSLSTLSTLPLPGVVLTDHLRVGDEQTGDQSVVTGLATGGAGDAPTTTRFVRVDPLTEQVQFGPALPTGVEVATAQYLTWTAFPSAPGGELVTEGYATVLDVQPQASARPPLVAGSKIYDGGGGFAAFLVVAPGSSVIGCRDPGGNQESEIDVAPALPDSVINGQVLRTDTAFCVITDRGLVRQGVGNCR